MKKPPNSNKSGKNIKRNFSKPTTPKPPNPKASKKSYEITYRVDNSKITGTCPICLNSTFDDPSNLVVEESIFHFDCVVNWIKSKFGVEENNKILYLGSNTFGIFWEGKTKKLELLKKINISEELKIYAKSSS